MTSKRVLRMFRVSTKLGGVTPPYVEHDGQVVRVLRQLGPTDADFSTSREPLFEIVASDGWRGHALESELKPVKTPRE